MFNKLLIIFSIFFLLLGCDGCKLDQFVEFIIYNNTSDSITYYIPPISEQICSAGLPEAKPDPVDIVPPNGKQGVFIRHGNYFDDLPTDTLHIFILNYHLYNTLPWDSIVGNNIIVERIKITEDSLKSIDYNIVVD